MKTFKLVKMAIVLVTLTSHQLHADEEAARLQGPWFGQNTPGSTPEIFAPGLVSRAGRYEFGMSFAPGLDEFYFTALEKGEDSAPEIHYSKIENGYWTKPKKANFSSGKLVYELLPHVSLTQQRIYFSGRLTESRDTNGIWYVSRQQNGWSEPKQLIVTPEKGRVSDFNQGKAGEIILTNMPERKVYSAKRINGEISVPKPLDIEFGVHGFISPKQDYLLVNARNPDEAGRRDSDLFVYFKKKDGTWSKPIPLGEQINTTYSETVARVSPDGKYLFFGRYNEPDKLSNIYWVSTDVIYDLKKVYFEGELSN